MSEQAPERGSVTVVGTAHVSAESVEEVEDAIEAERPDVVAVELDEGRYRQLRGDGPEDLDASDLLHGNTVFQFLAYWVLSYVQARMGDEFDITPGADMLAAVETAERLGLGIALVDRDIQVTIQRFWARLTGREKVSLMGGLVMSVAPPPQVGAAVGATVGLLVGVLLGTFGAGTLGLDAAAASLGSAAGAVGALVVGAGIALALLAFAGSLLPGGLAERLAVSLGLGVLAGMGLWLTGGLVVGPLDLSPDAFVSLGRGATTLALGVGVGIAVLGGIGTLLGMALDASVEEPDAEQLEMSDLTDSDVVSVMMEEFRRFSPGGAEALIDERDAFIAHKLVGLREQGKSVVAVVGAGHREGIERYLDRPETLPEMGSLTGVQKTRRFSPYKLVGYLFTLGFLVFFVLIGMAGVRDTFLLQLFGAWFLVNGAFAFALARIAGAHNLSALVGGAVAWLTSLNPLLAPGWFAGYVELRYTSVNVADIGTLNELLKDEERPLEDLLRDLRQVPLFKLILVVAFTNIGSTVASFLFAFVLLPALFSGQGISTAGEVADLMLQGARNSVDLLLGGFR
ncbi:TraB/GumN family protein [Halomarina ordinaria]|uniref:TraB/GumN family protein n=1 Tax=Halomarina ordinaria TaxID=3033939 RepID=A0ABD5U525_9EURY|nr:TraB/GumN family protein [Halomarina sp. PSRA2]